MAGNAVSRRAVAAVVGSLVADSAALPIHWIYDVTKLDEAVGGRSDPEFLAESHCPFYRIPTGRNSCYGDQTFVILESLTESKGFDVEDYKKRLFAKFGPNTEYEETPEESAGKKNYPVSHAWRNGSIKTFVNNYKEGRHEPMKEDASSDGLTKVAPIVALYAGRPELESVVREVVKVTQDNAVAIDAAVTAAFALEKYIVNGPPAGAVESWLDKVPSSLGEDLKKALDLKTTNHREVVNKFGSHCASPVALQGSVHALASSGGDYVTTIREAMLAGGDNCGRLGFIGAVMGASAGLDNIPKDWIRKTDCGDKSLQLAEKLVKLRP